MIFSFFYLPKTFFGIFATLPILSLSFYFYSMFVETKQLSPTEVEITIKETAQGFAPFYKKAIDNARENVSIKGFRKGSHISDDIVIAQVGAMSLQGDALNLFLDKEYPKALRKAGITPAAAGEVKTVTSVDPLEVVLIVETQPVAELDAEAVKKITVDARKTEVTTEEIDAEVQAIKDRFTHFHDAHGHSEDGFEANNDTIETGDRATISCQGYTQQGGDILAETKVDQFPLVIGSGSFIPGFEENVIGHKVGEEFGFDIIFPETYHAEDYKGRKVYFEVKIEKLEKPHTPEFSEDFIEKLRGVKTDMQGLRDILKQEIIRRKESQNRYELEVEIVDAIKKTGMIHIGPKALEAMIEDTYRQEDARVSEQGYSLKDYLSHTGQSQEDFKKETITPIAQTRLETQAVLRALESIIEAPVSDAEIKEEIDMVIAEYQNATVQTRLREKLVPGDKIYEDLVSRIRSRKTLDTFIKK